jgi:hypothetical protein
MKILAITDETTTCECCGKTNLKRVVVIEQDNGAIVRYGTDCASKAFRSSKGTFTSLVDYRAYVQKWLGKTPAYTAEIVAKGIWNKFGVNTKVENGVIMVLNTTGWAAIH